MYPEGTFIKDTKDNLVVFEKDIDNPENEGFVCYWEIYSNNDLARLAPAITQASFIHMLHRFIERGDMEEVNVVQQIMSNFVRLLSVLDTPNKNKEVNENDMGENDEDA